VNSLYCKGLTDQVIHSLPKEQQPLMANKAEGGYGATLKL